MKSRNILAFGIAIVLPQLAGLIGSLFTASAIPEWYAALAKPEIAPPNWIFAPVWTTLFVLMGIAAFLVWKNAPPRSSARIPLVIFGVQLALNTLWSIIFFGLESPGLAFIELCVLWLAIVATIISFSRVSLKAAWLLAPYLLWVSFAGYLNYAIWALN